MVQEKAEYDYNFRSTCAQVAASFVICILSLNVGFIMCMPTIVIGALRAENSTMALTESQASWFGSLLYITQPFGSLISGFSTDYLGRKLSLLVINLPQLISWIILYFSSSVVQLYATVILMGLSMGFLEAPVMSYIGEVTQPRLRGVLCCYAGIFYNMGFLLETFLGASMPWRTMVLWSTIGPVVGFIAIFMLPESPAWLVSKGRVREAEKAFQWLRGWVSPEAVRQELEDMIKYVRETTGTKKIDGGEYKAVATSEGSTLEKPKTGTLGILLEPGVLVAFRIVFIYFIVMACASLFAMRPFFIEILDGLSLPISSHYIVVICAALQSLGAITMALTLKRMGKRGITFVSLGLSVFCCLGLGVYLLAGVNFPWLPVTLFALSYFAASLGILVVPWLLTIELFPLRARGTASGICAAIAYIFLSLVTKTYYNLEAWLNVSGTCFFYGVIGVLGFIYLYVDMPETEGVPLEIIERRLNERASIKKQDRRNGDIDGKEEV